MCVCVCVCMFVDECGYVCGSLYLCFFANVPTKNAYTKRSRKYVLSTYIKNTI